MFRQFALLGALVAAPQVAPAETVTLGSAGFGSPLSASVAQASLPLHAYVQTAGDFYDLGGIRWYAGQKVLEDDFSFKKAEGQLLNINEYASLFSVMGTRFGGDGRVTFRLPDLRGRAVKGASDTSRIGTVSGQARSERTTLSAANLPEHDHQLNGTATSSAGAGAAFSVEQQSIALRYTIEEQGMYPGGLAPGNTIAEVRMSASSFIVPPIGQSDADGELRRIADNNALFSLIGTTFGGDGRVTMALPNAENRIVTGAGDGPGLIRRRLGGTMGNETVALTERNLPAHQHTGDGSVTSTTGGNQPFSIIQPELALNWIVALQGLFPSQASVFESLGEPVIGEMTMFAGNFAPRGWTFAHGQLLPISQNQALFSLLGTTYGGDGRTTFALPDMRGRTAVGTGQTATDNFIIGQAFGADTLQLTTGSMPEHTHTAEIVSPVPLPAGFGLMLGALSLLGFGWHRRRSA